MKGRRALLGSLAALVVASSFVVVPVAFADPDDGAKEKGHVTYVFCHRTGSDKPYVLVGSDDAGWDEAHQGSAQPPATDPAHPPLNGVDDFLIASGVGIKKQDYSLDQCPTIKK